MNNDKSETRIPLSQMDRNIQVNFLIIRPIKLTNESLDLYREIKGSSFDKGG